MILTAGDFSGEEKRLRVLSCAGRTAAIGIVGLISGDRQVKRLKGIALSCSSRKYLKSIYQMSRKTGYVHPTDIANDLCVAKPSVTRAIKILIGEGMAQKNSEGEICLTALGTAAAEALSDKYETVRDFFSKTIGDRYMLSKQEVMELSDSISDQAVEAIRGYLFHEEGVDQNHVGNSGLCVDVLR